MMLYKQIKAFSIRSLLLKAMGVTSKLSLPISAAMTIYKICAFSSPLRDYVHLFSEYWITSSITVQEQGEDIRRRVDLNDPSAASRIP